MRKNSLLTSFKFIPDGAEDALADFLPDFLPLFFPFFFPPFFFGGMIVPVLLNGEEMQHYVSVL